MFIVALSLTRTNQTILRRINPMCAALFANTKDNFDMLS